VSASAEHAPDPIAAGWTRRKAKTAEQTRRLARLARNRTS